MLVTEADIANQNPNVYQHDRENIVSRMDHGARLEAQGIIRDRIDTAADQTNEMKSLMDKLDRQDDGLFQDDKGDEEERLFLPKSREDLDIVYAFLLDTVTQLRPLVSVWPKLANLNQPEIDWKKCKVAEALIQFYFDDVWRFVDNQFPIWLRHFLLYPSAYYKISYMETDYDPDLKLDVVDRALLYLDPMAKRVEDSQWIGERYFITKHEVMERVNRGDWTIPAEDLSTFEQHMTIGNTTDDELSRYFGTKNRTPETVESDQLVEIVDYWQFPRKGLGDVYAVMVGGEEGTLVRYGRNFNPYKHNQYIGSSYRQKDRPDGLGLTQQLRPFQKIINHFINTRYDDVKANVQRRVAVDRQLVDDDTIQEINRGESWVSLNTEVADAYMAAGKKISDGFFTLPIQTSTGELLTHDLPFILSQRQDTSHISDVFRGAPPAPGTPLGIVQEQLIRSAGAFKPVIRQIVLPVEKIAEIMLEYFKADEFYSSDRVVTIIGKNRYQQVMPEAWKTIGDGVSAIQVTADMMPRDVRFNAVTGADAFAAKTMLNSMIANLFQGLGQVGPEIQGIIARKFNFASMFSHMLNISGLDVESLEYTDAEIKANDARVEQARQQQKQDLLEQQQIAMKIQQSMEQFKHMLDTERDRLKQQYRTEAETVIDKVKIDAQNEAAIEQIVKKIMTDMMAKKTLADQKHAQTIEQMVVEGAIEEQKGVTNVSPSGGRNVQISNNNNQQDK